MLKPANLIPLSPTLTIQVQWSTRVDGFVHEWQHRLAVAEGTETQDEDHVVAAAVAVLGSVEQRHDQTVQALSNLYRVSGQLPVPGDVLLVEPLELRVDERRLVPSKTAGISHVTVIYFFGIERYVYDAMAPPTHSLVVA